MPVNMDKLNEWAVNLAAAALQLMGLQRWEVFIHQEPGMERVADVQMQPEYETTLLRVSDTITDGREGAISIIHEVIHLQHAPLYTAQEYVLAMVPEDRRELCRTMLNEADELVVQREAKAWAGVADLAEFVLAANDGIQRPGGCTTATSRGIMARVNADQESLTVIKED